MHSALRKKSPPPAKCSIASLPNEVILEIFKYLNPQQLTYGVSLVSQRWQGVALDPSVWHFQTLKDEDIQDSLHILSLAPALHTVHVTKWPKPDEVYEALTKGHKDIKNLNIHFAEGCFSAKQISDLLLRFPNLQQVDIQFPASMLDRGVCTAFKSLSKLHSLKISGVITDTEQLIEALTRCSSLRILDLSDCRIVLRDQHLAWLLDSEKLWDTLHLVTHFVTEQGYGVIRLCRSLRDLALIKCRNLSQGSLEHVGTLTQLRALAIRENCVLSAAALTSFFNKESMLQLVKVDLTVYRADDEVALTVATNCTGLMHLRLAMCLLTDKGVRDIVLNAPLLTHLDLEFNNIRGDALLLIPKSLPNLTYLNLHLCYNVHINLLQLAQTLPNFTIIDPTGFPISTTSQESLPKFVNWQTFTGKFQESPFNPPLFLRCFPRFPLLYTPQNYERGYQKLLRKS